MNDQYLRPRGSSADRPSRQGLRRGTQHVTLAIIATCLGALTGCQIASDAAPQAVAAPPVAYLSIDELSAAMERPSEVLLVEFCVPVGCARCAQMRGPIDQLASDGRAGLTVRRVDLGQNPQLMWDLNLTACPSYVAFRDGEEIFRAAHPTSADLIAAQLDESLRQPVADPGALAVQ